jgi:hypothetical protein
MLIQCTKKLLDELNIKPVNPVDAEPLFSWHANLIIFNRRKTIVLVNDKNRYAIILYGLKAKDFKNIDELIMKAIRETLQEEGIKNEVIDQFLNHSKVISFAKTKDRSSVARMNKACDIVYFYDDLLDETSIIQSAMGIKISQALVGDGNKNYMSPNEEMYKDLEIFDKKSIFSCKALEITVSLDLEKFNVWRKVIVPYHITLTKFHKVLQAAFGWNNYHLHEFYIFNNEITDTNLSINHSGYHKEGFLPVLNIVCDEEAFSYENDVPIKLETGLKLSEYISYKIKYNYDFGDDWHHYIDITRVIYDYDKNYPICIDGEGNTPPEDVGGEFGYYEFLKIIADENHPEYNHFVEWTEMNGYKDFDIEVVNRRLKYL